MDHDAKPDQASPADISTSRRNFLRLSGTAIGAVATVGVGKTAMAQTSGAAEIPSLQLADAFRESLAEPVTDPSFDGAGMTGAEVFAQLCKKENLAALFCCPGNYTVINALAAVGIPAFGGRTEGSMCAMADGFSRATGEVVATSGTEGPGFTHMIMNIAAANAARTPLLVLASNMTLAGEDREAFIQHAYHQPTTEGMKKYGKRLINPSRVHEYGATAFRHLKSGVPQPVHLDFPAEVARARFKSSSDLTDYYDKEQYRSESRAYPSPTEMKSVIDLLNAAQRPLLIAGQGVFQRKGWDALRRAAEKADLGVVTSGPSRGFFADGHRLSLAAAPDALLSADLVVFIGQYCMPSPNEYRVAAGVKTVRVHPVQEDLGRNWPLDLGIVADESHFLEELAENLPARKRDAWVDEIAKARAAFQKRNDDLYKQGLDNSARSTFLHPAVIARDMQHFIDNHPEGRLAIATGFGGWTSGLYSGFFLRAYRPGQEIVPAYQYGAIGPDAAMMMGVSCAVQNGVGPQAGYQGVPTMCITSDAGIGYSLMELDTAQKYGWPTIIVVYNNNAWGVFPLAANTPRAGHMYLFQENIRYDQMAQQLGARGEVVRTPEEYRAALDRAYKAGRDEKVSTLINCLALKDFTASQEYPPGVSIPVQPGVGAFSH